MFVVPEGNPRFWKRHNGFGLVTNRKGTASAVPPGNKDNAALAAGVQLLMSRSSADVVQELLNEMNRVVVSYPESVIPTGRKLEDLIDGTAFFPGGTGLWRGREPGGALPTMFPEKPVLFLAYNFGDPPSFEQAKKDKGEAHKAFAKLWTNLLDFLAHARPLELSQCFFTNAYMGLKSNGRSGIMPSDARFTEQCIRFLGAQAEIIDPGSVVLLGDEAEALWQRAKRLHANLRSLPSTKIMHPSARPLNQQPSPEIWKQKQGLAIGRLLTTTDNCESPTQLMPKAAQYQPAKMWSGRFREPLDHTFEQWQRSFPFDWRLLPEEVAASKAHAQTIAAAGILTAAELDQTLQGLNRVGERVINWSRRINASSPTLDYDPTQQIGSAIVASASQAEDIHHFVELELTKEIGTLALKLHTGRSRNEQIATDLRLFVREAIDSAATGVRAWAEAFLHLAEQAGEQPMPSYTHLQRAEPVLIAHWLLAYVSMIERDLSRLEDCRKRLNLCPLGSGAVAGATLALDRSIAAEALGFDGPTPNSIDATSDRDFALEFAQVAAQIGLHLSRFAEELTLYSTAEFGFLDLPERFSTGSSAMPQKKNPDLTELVRGKSGRLIGGATTLAVILKGLPLAYNKDMQETQEAVFDVADTLVGMLRLMAPFTAALEFRFERMAAAATQGYLNAMAAATYLVHKGVPFRTAHEKTGNAVRFAIDRGVELNDLSLEDLRQFGDEFGEDFFEAVGLRATLDCHDVVGGTATGRVREALRVARERFPVVADGD